MIASISTRQRGQRREAASNFSAFVAFAPQREQCRLPTNIIAKQRGHAMVASRASQNEQCVASVKAAAPQVGQLSVSAFNCFTSWPDMTGHFED
jgi:hypothetical protein